jgi:hypothetical protein
MKILKVVKQTNSQTFRPETIVTFQLDMETIQDLDTTFGDDVYKYFGQEFFRLLSQFK